jgi:hypothetical protein
MAVERDIDMVLWALRAKHPRKSIRPLPHGDVSAANDPFTAFFLLPGGRAY